MERFVVYADRVEGAGWHLRIAYRPNPADTAQEAILCQRDIGRVGDDFTGYFPQPPPGEGTEESFGAENDGVALRNALQALKARPVPQNTAEEFGRYLFLTLLGDACWTEITRRAGQAPLELALCWKAGERELSALPWELMRGAQGFLVADSTRPVAITRLIADAQAGAPVMPSPLRVLFVIGSAPDDTRIRAGAEYLGLMRHMDAKELAGDWESAGLHPRLLVRATSQQLQDEIARFAPSVVHFICHGGVSNGHGYLEFAAPDGAQQPGAPAFTQMAAANLLPILRPQQKAGEAARPFPLIVLNACDTATYDKAEQAVPLAVELIQGGVPLVVGMAGEISDQACRLFTRRFYEALVRSQSFVGATAEGRLAGVIHLGSQAANLDWAMPTLFLAEGVAPRLEIDLAGLNAWVRLKKIALSYAQINNPSILAGRFEVVEQGYQALIRIRQSGGTSILALNVAEKEANLDAPQYGKTRLLQQLAAQSVRDGFLPCLLTFAQGDPVPGNLLGIALALFETILAAREYFGIPTSAPSSILAYARQALAANASPFAPTGNDLMDLESVRKHVDALDSDATGAGNVMAIKAALRQDFLALRNDAAAPYPNAWPIILVDDIHRFGAVVADFLKLLGTYGLGDLSLPIPVVITYSGSLTDPASATAMTELKAFNEQNLRHVRYEKLRPFGPPAEDEIPYRQFLLSCKQPLMIRADADINQLKKWMQLLHNNIRGVPSKMTHEVRANNDVFTALEAGLLLGALKEAGDEEALDLVRRDNGVGYY